MRKKKDKYKAIINILSVCIVVAVAVVSLLIVRLKIKENGILVNKTETPVTFSTAASEMQSISDEASSEAETTKAPFTIFQNVTQRETTQESLTSEVTEAQSFTEGETSEPKLSESGRIIVDVKRKDWNFIVVNSSREMPEGYVPELKEILGCGKYLDKRVAPYYEKMYYAAKKDGITLTPYSAYRSYDRQKINYENLTDTYMSRYNISRKKAAEKAATVILPPGTSEHNLGLAMDICNTLDSFADTKEYKWLTENAHKYGFILRYTAEKKSITGIVPEPWHWRFVGVEYAGEIRDSGLCLEEWLDSKGIGY